MTSKEHVGGVSHLHQARQRLATFPLEAALGVAALANSARFFVDPDAPTAVVRVVLHPFDFIWAGMYGLAGVVTLIGLMIDARRVIASGLALLAGGLAVQMIAFTSLGLDAVIVLTIVSQFAFFVGVVVRLRQALRGEVIGRGQAA